MRHPIFATQAGDFVVATLCLWRVTHLVSQEEGPCKILTRLRERLGEGFFGGLVDCFYCLSMWLAIPLALGVGEDATQRGLLWLALSGSACLLEQVTRRLGWPGVYEETKE